MLCTVGNEDLTRTAKREADAISNEEEYRLSHIMSTPIEPETAPVLVDLNEVNNGILHNY